MPTAQDSHLKIRISVDRFLNFVNSFPVKTFLSFAPMQYTIIMIKGNDNDSRITISGKKVRASLHFYSIIFFCRSEMYLGNTRVNPHAPSVFAAQEKDNGRVAHHKAGRSEREEEYNNIISPPAPPHHRRRSCHVFGKGGEGDEKIRPDAMTVDDQVSASDAAAAFPLFPNVPEFNERENQYIIIIIIMRFPVIM
ncbi:unnamed protein product [Macrosiphum euphorbiae]|uniref:Uncharacterized protein n=1 Tax=Macrosiphum euphorbiae TaxID=13131 RepID=A0AAV0WYK6_9HEMI|nr:unnamed protein product [Macrosiphum euphorbiae]